MPVAALMELAKASRYEEFETRCMELIDAGGLTLPQLVAPFEQFARAGQAEPLAGLVQMIFDNVAPAADLRAALTLARIALHANPKDDALRRRTVELYRAAFGDQPHFDAVLESSGLAGGRPTRTALAVLDLCLTLEPGDTLISRMDGRVVEVTEVDRQRALFTLRREGRVTTRPAEEVTREFERIAADDFRVLRQLRSDQLTTLVNEDPVRVVIGLIHAHGGVIDADLLKHELVPRYIEAKAWSKWWTGTRNLLKRNPHVIIEGRSPVVLSYSAEGQTLEEETWDAFAAARDPALWLEILDSYLREKHTLREAPAAGLLEQCHRYLVEQVAAVRARRPAEALTIALTLLHLGTRGLPMTDESRALARGLLREAADPAACLASVQPDTLRERGLAELQAARPDDWATHALTLLPLATANLLERLVPAALAAGRRDAVQGFIDEGLSDLVHHPELAVWLWKGGAGTAELNVPTPDDLFRLLLDTLSALGRTVAAEAEVVKPFRQRIKTALSARDFAQAQQCFGRMSAEAAITVRRQIERLEGIGPTVQGKLVDLLRDVHPQLWVVKRRQLHPWEDPDTLWVTEAGLQRRTAERDELVNVKMRENAKRIGEAASLGDLSENSEYKFALEERDLLRARLATINDELSRARALSPHDVPEAHVGIGSRVRVRHVADGREQVITFLGPFETDVEGGIYSYQTPLAQRLLGKAPGERVRLTVTGGESEVEIVALENALAG